MKFMFHRNKLTLSSVILLSYIARLKNEVIEIQTRTMSREQAVFQFPLPGTTVEALT